MPNTYWGYMFLTSDEDVSLLVAPIMVAPHVTIMPLWNRGAWMF